MTRAILALLAALSVLPAALAAAQPPPASPAAEARARDIGDRLDVRNVAQPGTPVQWGRGEMVLDVPFDRTQRIIQDYAHYQDWMPFFRVSRVLSRRGANALVYMQASVIHNTTTLWAQLRIFARRPQNGTHVIEARMTEGNMDRFLARWELTPIEGGTRTLVAFQILVDPDLPFPSGTFSDENRRASRRTLQALRRRAAQQPRVARNP